MPSQQNPEQEHPSTYVVADRANEEEMLRLNTQDHLLTSSMGGVLPEQTDLSRFTRILDVGCATGGWLIEVARALPQASLRVGIDVSKRMLDYAQAQAEAQQVNERVEFHVMDALRMLEFPSQTFNLVNQRIGTGYLRTWDWQKLLQEYQRVCVPGGIVRVTEMDVTPRSNSPALMQIGELFVQALANAGHLFTSQGDSIVNQLPKLLEQHGLQNVQTHAYTLEHRNGSPEWPGYVENTMSAFRTLAPFLRKWTQVPDDYEAIYQQMLHEIQQPDAFMIGTLVTAWGTNAL